MRFGTFKLIAALLLGSSAVPGAFAQDTATSSTGLSAGALKQLQEIYALKASLTPAERKMSFNLAMLSRLVRGKLPAGMVQFIQLPVRNAAGKFAVEVQGRTGASLERRGLADVDTGAVPAFAPRDHVRARVALTELLKLAEQSDVQSIEEPSLAHTNAGSVTSQGYIAHGANKVISGGVTGAGIKVGVLSDSAYPSRVAALIASGDLPADTVVLPGQAGPADNSGEDEGTAMMEIVHDIAPNAKIFFATAFVGGQAAFAANIRALRYTYGCDIIVDDISYFAEPAFQDGIVALAVNDVTANGALYFSSAANSGSLDLNTSGTWEGDFSPSTTSSTLIDNFEGGPVTLHNFGTSGSPQAYDVLKSAASSGIGLHWSDPFGASSNDYDLVVTNSTGTTILGYGANAQTGTQNPFEFASVTGGFPAGSRVYVVLYDGVTRALHVDTERATLTIATQGATIGHNAGLNTFSTAAVYWNAAKRGAAPFVGGSTNPDESFSSDGPRKIFYRPDGTPITPGNLLFSTSGGQTLQKPDAAGADGVSTATPGFSPFFGTSAGAPHLAGIAALVKSANPSLTNTQIRAIMTGTALDNMAPGVDRDSGYGIVSATNAVAAAKALAAQSAAAQ